MILTHLVMFSFLNGAGGTVTPIVQPFQGAGQGLSGDWDQQGIEELRAEQRRLRRERADTEARAALEAQSQRHAEADHAENMARLRRKAARTAEAKAYAMECADIAQSIGMLAGEIAQYDAELLRIGGLIGAFLAEQDRLAHMAWIETQNMNALALLLLLD